MRLNNSIKNAFVKAVLDDTGFIDFNTQFNDRLKNHFYKIAPPEVKAIYDNPKTRPYIGQNSVSLHYGTQYLGWFCSLLVPVDGQVTDMDLLAELAFIKTQEKDQNDKRRELEAKLHGVIDSFTTVKLAREALPEFAKYLPEVDGSRCKTLPAIAGLVADLQNVGWKPAKTA